MIFDILEIIIKTLELIILSIFTTLGLINLNRKLKIKKLELEHEKNNKRKNKHKRTNRKT